MRGDCGGEVAFPYRAKSRLSATPRPGRLAFRRRGCLNCADRLENSTMSTRILILGAVVVVVAVFVVILIRKVARLLPGDPEERAIEAVVEKGGKLERDESARGRPVKVIRLARSHV